MKLLISSLLILTPLATLAHGGAMHGTKPVVKEQKEWGIVRGTPSKLSGL
jgi:hypothetical protein